MSVNYQEELNKSQQAAVFYNDGPSLVIAGAGAGKTRVLTYKITYLLEQGVEPWNILALTFTNKAAREMKARIALMLDEQKVRYLWMDTFHSVFARILRIESAVLGYKSNFTIYDQTDSRSLIKSIVKEMQLDDKVYKPNVVQERISSAKNQLILPDAYAASADAYRGDQARRIPAVRDVYRAYWMRCRQANAMDFDDLLVNTYLLFERYPEIREQYVKRFHYVLVDEYQDTNYAQHQIVWQLTRDNQQLCVVGDDAQSIYSFRGANIDNILKFNTLYPSAKLFKLEQNYRSTQMIVNAANSLIEKNHEQIPKSVYSHKEEGEPLTLFRAYSDVEEGEIVVNKIQELHRKEYIAYDEFAILYRTNAQSRVFEESLRKRTMPYRIYGGMSFYQRKEIKDIIAYYRLAVNPMDEEALKRVINYPARGIGDTTLLHVIEAASAAGVSLWEVICSPEQYALEVSKGFVARLQQFATLIQSFIEDALTKDAYEVGKRIAKESGVVADIYRDSTPEGIARQENVEELMNGIQNFVISQKEEGNEREKLTDFLSEVSLLSDQDKDKSTSDEKVTLMTMHAAKGLEFKVVFVVGVEENLFPSPMCAEMPRALEEERRLFYVAITRAEQYCFLSFAKSRFRFGKVEYGEPSRFLKDISSRYLRSPRGVLEREEAATDFFGRGAGTPRRTFEKPTNPEPPARRNLKPVSYSNFLGNNNAKSDVPQLKVGQVIEHERFGIGDVEKVEGAGDNAKATIRFRNVGVKQLLLKFARFKVIE